MRLVSRVGCGCFWLPCAPCISQRFGGMLYSEGRGVYGRVCTESRPWLCSCAFAGMLCLVDWCSLPVQVDMRDTAVATNQLLNTPWCTAGRRLWADYWLAEVAPAGAVR
jgi:hypothetical protein